ncbi:MATE domain protein [Marvinbryantia formatexigens DSM 14469]|uniref:Probable multidrug resistance protein NorM n=1 Tax=Marvinbryantia formatexigens DSM 14469 TaxID=478749 RepID=C6LEA7_9FIRM|nr:MATE family efflux transporter [Marvinbryantia formatexigens]EET60890.1 MATE domain protein [Marvinbryantia formatexigens DSM 14469]UWO24806.1 MATE family efflux transporter [Marvinbryantia formatexigens DSM 14469]SDF24153.1 MatE protein [Marvinbryantia formatexigens]
MKKDNLFTNEDLKKMIVPLFLEQLLVMLVGIADTLVVSYAGEAAVSGVSLVNQFNTIFIYLFTALASGGAVVISQYIGKKETDHAVYNSGAAVYRSLGKTSATMYISFISNAINVIGNMVGVFALKAGVAGVAWPSLIARIVSAVMITYLCFQRKNEVHYRRKWIFHWNRGLLKCILKVAVPNGVENGIFQLVKVALSSIVALFGTYQIAANGVAQSIWSLAALAGLSMGPVFITVIGQCMGSHDTESADYYFNKLTKITLISSTIWNILIFLLLPLFLKFYSLEEETKELVVWLVLIHNIFNAIAMVCDWVIRAIIFIWRQKSGKWKAFEVI